MVSLRVLVADDYPPITQTLAWMVEACGHEALMCFDTDEAVRGLSEFKPHIVLLELRLSPMGGHDACRAMRRQASPERLWIIGHSVDVNRSIRAEAFSAGFDDVLCKPIMFATVETLIEEVETEIRLIKSQ